MRARGRRVSKGGPQGMCVCVCVCVYTCDEGGSLYL